MNFFKKKASTAQGDAPGGADKGVSSTAKDDDDSWDSFSAGNKGTVSMNENPAAKAGGGGGRPSVLATQESEITWNDRPQGLVRAERAMTAKKVEIMLTEEERQERAWAEAEKREEERMSSQQEAQEQMLFKPSLTSFNSASTRSSTGTVASSSFNSTTNHSHRRASHISLAASMVAVTPGHVSDAYEFLQLASNNNNNKSGGGGGGSSRSSSGGSSSSSSSRSSNISSSGSNGGGGIYGPESGEGIAKSLGQGAFGKVYCGRRKLNAGAASLIFPTEGMFFLASSGGGGGGGGGRGSGYCGSGISGGPDVEVEAGQLVAIKEVRKAAMKNEDLRALKKEVAMLVGCQAHGSVLRFVAWYESQEAFHIVTECCLGGELHTTLSKLRRAARAKKAALQGGHPDDYTLPGVSEDTARTIISSLLHTLAFLQDQHIAHRDVKPENILLRAPLLPPPSLSSDNSGGGSGGNSNTSSSSSSSKSSLVLESDVVLCDFGFATRCSGRSLSNVCGSTAYMAPEVVRGMNYDYRCDCWSAGVVAFILLCGQLPFQGDTDVAMERAIKRSKGFVPYDSDLYGGGGGGDSIGGGISGSSFGGGRGSELDPAGGSGGGGRASATRSGSAVLRTGLTPKDSTQQGGGSGSSSSSLRMGPSGGSKGDGNSGSDSSLQGRMSSFQGSGSVREDAGSGSVGGAVAGAGRDSRGSEIVVNSSRQWLSQSSLFGSPVSGGNNNGGGGGDQRSLDSVRGFEKASLQAREFVCCALLPSPDRRMKARQLLQLPWFTSAAQPSAQPSSASASCASSASSAAVPHSPESGDNYMAPSAATVLASSGGDGSGGCGGDGGSLLTATPPLLEVAEEENNVHNKAATAGQEGEMVALGIRRGSSGLEDRRPNPISASTITSTSEVSALSSGDAARDNVPPPPPLPPSGKTSVTEMTTPPNSPMPNPKQPHLVTTTPSAITPSGGTAAAAAATATAATAPATTAAVSARPSPPPRPGAAAAVAVPGEGCSGGSGGKGLRRGFSDIGVGADSVFHQASASSTSTNQSHGPTPSATAMLELAAIGTKVQPRRVWNDSLDDDDDDDAARQQPSSSGSSFASGAQPSRRRMSMEDKAASAAAAAAMGSAKEWWAGVLEESSSFICPLTKRPFEDPVISLEDGCTYERHALARRNLARAVAERQKAAWADARRDALDELVWDDSFTMPEKLNRLVSLKAAGVLGRPATGAQAQAAFDAAKAEVLANTSKCAPLNSKNQNRRDTPQQAKQWANELARQALAAGALSKEETRMFLGKSSGVGNRRRLRGGSSGDDESEEDEDNDEDDNIGVSPAMALVIADQTRSERGSVDSFGSVNSVGSAASTDGSKKMRRRGTTVAKSDRIAGVVPNKAMRQAVLELQKMVQAKQLASSSNSSHSSQYRRGDGGGGGSGNEGCLLDLATVQDNHSKVHRELAQAKKAKEEAKQKEQQRLMREQLLKRDLTLKDLVGGNLTDLAKPYVSPLSNKSSSASQHASTTSVLGCGGGSCSGAAGGGGDGNTAAPSKGWGKLKAAVTGVSAARAVAQIAHESAMHQLHNGPSPSSSSSSSSSSAAASSDSAAGGAGGVSGSGGGGSGEVFDDSAVIASVVVTAEKTNDDKVVYRTVVKNKGGSAGSCSHRFNEYRIFNERLALLGGVANLVGGQHKLQAISDVFPDKAHHKRAFLGAAQLTEEQVEARRSGLEAWMRALMMPWRKKVQSAKEHEEEAALLASGGGSAAAAAAGNIGELFLLQGDKGADSVLVEEDMEEAPVASPIRALLWECLRLDARVTHL